MRISEAGVAVNFSRWAYSSELTLGSCDSRLRRPGASAAQSGGAVAKTMKREEILKLLEQVGAIRQGHFELSSGRHSATYIQCALVLQFPQHAERLGGALAEQFRDHSAACVVSPALGGIVIGHEVARALAVRSLFVERDRSGQMALRRGFELSPGERVLVIEDVWTTGGSTRETIGVVEHEG